LPDQLFLDYLLIYTLLARSAPSIYDHNLHVLKSSSSCSCKVIRMQFLA